MLRGPLPEPLGLACGEEDADVDPMLSRDGRRCFVRPGERRRIRSSYVSDRSCGEPPPLPLPRRLGDVLGDAIGDTDVLRELCCCTNCSSISFFIILVTTCSCADVSFTALHRRAALPKLSRRVQCFFAVGEPESDARTEGSPVPAGAKSATLVPSFSTLTCPPFTANVWRAFRSFDIRRDRSRSTVAAWSSRRFSEEAPDVSVAIKASF